MQYTTISTWELSDGADFDMVLEQVRTKRLPALQNGPTAKPAKPRRPPLLLSAPKSARKTTPR